MLLCVHVVLLAVDKLLHALSVVLLQLLMLDDVSYSFLKICPNFSHRTWLALPRNYNKSNIVRCYAFYLMFTRLIWATEHHQAGRLTKSKHAIRPTYLNYTSK